MTGCRATPDDFDLKLKQIEAKIQNITLLLQFNKAPSIPLGDNLSGTTGQKTLRDAPADGYASPLKLTANKVTFFAVDSVVCCAPEGRPVG